MISLFGQGLFCLSFALLSHDSVWAAPWGCARRGEGAGGTVRGGRAAGCVAGPGSTDTSAAGGRRSITTANRGACLGGGFSRQPAIFLGDLTQIKLDVFIKKKKSPYLTEG